MWPLLNPQSKGDKNLFKKRCNWLINILSTTFEMVGSMFIGS